MGLARYNQMRDFKMTPEPRGEAAKRGKGKSSFVIQKHDARRLHYDFRLEYDGVLMSWAVPKGPSLDPKDKRLAVRTEDHPLSYATFEGDIPHGHYGAGHVIVWDNGTWDPPEDVPALLREGHLDFELQGQKLRGRWSLIRLRNRGGERRDNWLLFKRPDRYAREDYDIVEERPESVLRKKRPPWKGAPLPEFVKPQLALLVDEVPEGEEWIHEIKFDGYRTLARLEDGGVRMLTRSGLDWTKKYGPLARELKALRIENALMDGEVIWTDARGRADFQGLQNALSSGNLNRLTYYVFDLLHLNGADLTGLPLKERKAKLKKLLARNKTRVQRVLYSEHWAHQGKAMLKQSCKIGLEGVVSKEAYQPYVPGRSPLWQKTKCSLRQEFVIGGYAASKSGGRSFGALLLGVYEEGGLRYAGRVGTGFSAETMRDLKARFDDLESGESPFTVNSPRGRDIHWLEPKLAGEVEFKAWTGDGLVRHASFQGLRADKAPKSVHQERIVSSKTAETKLKITHPDRVIYSKSKTLKADVLKYYAEVADLMFPFLENRPASILRCQNTSTKACFFQKHGLAGFQDRPVHYKDKSGEALCLESPADIPRMAQNGGLEFHVWGTRFSHVTKPDLIVFDLDPETDRLWPRVVETALEIRDMLETLGLQSFVKVTGGKGLHVQVPVEPLYSWDTIKSFSHSLMKVLESEEPGDYTTNMIKAKRKGKIFLDYLRNGYGATAVVPYSLRAREYPTVAMPIAWREVRPSLDPAGYSFDEVIKMLRKRRKDPWADYWDVKQEIAVLGPKKSRSRTSHAPAY